jgi:protein SCO1
MRLLHLSFSRHALSMAKLLAAAVLVFLVSSPGTQAVPGGNHHGAVADAQSDVLAGFDRVMVTPPRLLEDFQLTDQNGAKLRLSDLRGSPLLLFFGFTHCADICPTTLAKLKAVREGAPQELKSVRVLFISVDAERDTPAVLKSYLSGLSPDFIGLTGSQAEVQEVARQFSAAVFKGNPTRDSHEYSVEHSSRVYLIDSAGRLRAELYDASIETTQQVVRKLLSSEQ